MRSDYPVVENLFELDKFKECHSGNWWRLVQQQHSLLKSEKIEPGCRVSETADPVHD